MKSESSRTNGQAMKVIVNEYLQFLTVSGEFDMGVANIIEQRWSQRRIVVLNVDVFNHGSLMTSCNSRDVGLGGMFLETDTSSFAKDQDIELYFSFGADGQTKHKLKAKVIRVLTEGVGLMFKDFDTSSFRALQEIMRHSMPESSAP